MGGVGLEAAGLRQWVERLWQRERRSLGLVLVVGTRDGVLDGASRELRHEEAGQVESEDGSLPGSRLVLPPPEELGERVVVRRPETFAFGFGATVECEQKRRCKRLERCIDEYRGGAERTYRDHLHV